jgi:hypothetical protein
MQYSYRLLANFTASPDSDAALPQFKILTTIVAWSVDELMQSDRYADVVMT